MNDFLNNFISRTKDLAGIATKKTGEVLENSKLKIEAIKVDTKIKAAYEKMGIAVYAMVKERINDEELIADITSEIDELYEELEDLTAKIEMYKNSIICPVCDAKNGFNSLYCSQCGEELLDEDDYEEPIMDEDESYDDECDCSTCNCGCGSQQEESSEKVDSEKKEEATDSMQTNNEQKANSILNEIYKTYEDENNDEF